MIADIDPRRTDRVGVGRAAALLDAHEPLVEALQHQRAGDLGEEFLVEPGGEPADLDPLADVGRQQPALLQLGAARLVEELGDDGGARHRRIALGHQHRRGGGRIEHQELLAALPDPLLDGAVLEPMLGQRQPDVSRMRAERMMEKCQHGALRLRADAAGIRAVQTNRAAKKSQPVIAGIGTFVPPPGASC